MKTSHKNYLRSQCRTCLRSHQNKYNLHKIPDLKQFLESLLPSHIFITLNWDPQFLFLCDLCFAKLKDSFEFRNQIHEASKRIRTILQSEDDQSDDDNKLLLPELAEWNVIPIKSETIELHEPEENFELQTEIKTELNFEFEPEDSNSCDLDVFNNSQETSKAQKDFRKRDRSKKSFKCPRCNKHAYKKIYLDAHIRKIHEGLDKPFLCSVSECQKAFTRYNQLHVHFQTNHTLNIKFECDIDGCNQSFRLGQTLESHKRTFHKNKNLTPMKFDQVKVKHKEQINSDYENENECQVCSKKYSSKRALLEHLRRHNNDKRHFCNVCGVGKVTKTELQTHMRTHNNNLEKFKCSLCPQKFNHKNAISRHVRVVHEGERRFSCSFCPRRFGTKNSQVCHERLHTGEKPFQCELCSKGFAQVEGLKSHMKNHNKFLRKHICQYCEARFITKKNLIDHEQRHMSDKPHICGTCSRGFPRREDLEFHRKEYHGDLINEDFENNFMEEYSEKTSQSNNEKYNDLDKIYDQQKLNEGDPLSNEYDNEHILS